MASKKALEQAQYVAKQTHKAAVQTGLRNCDTQSYVHPSEPPCMLHRWLEEELARRYRDAAPATLALLQERCEGAAAELVAAESRLQAAEDVTSLRRAGESCSSVRHASNSIHVRHICFV